MTMRYRYGWPLGRLAARIGIPTRIELKVIHDPEAGVFVGTSDDVRGLIVEADSLEEVMREARGLIPELIGQIHSRDGDGAVVIKYRDRLFHE